NPLARNTHSTWTLSFRRRLPSIKQRCRLSQALTLRTKKPTGSRGPLLNGCSILRYYAGLTMDITLPPDFKEFLRLLNTHGVEYLLIGGYAVGYHGYPRATNDMDIWIAIHPQNAERMVAVLRAFGFDTPNLSPDLFLQD